MNKRYIKVFVLYALSNIFSQVILRNFRFGKSLLQILMGYNLFALGLKYMTYLKKTKNNIS